MAKFFLRNPGFELGDQDWTKGTNWTVEKDAVNARSGSWVAKKTAGADTSLNQSTAINIRPGNKLTVSGWYKHTADYDSSSDIVVQWLDKDGVLISVSSTGVLAAGTTAYTQLSLADTIAPDRAKAAIIRARSGTATLGNLWLDDLDLTGDIIEDIPAAAVISTCRMIHADTVGVFDPLVGADKFTEFNAGMSDKWAGVYTFIPSLGGDLGEMMAFMSRLGKNERFFAYDDDRKVPLNGIVNGMTVDGATTQGTNRIPVKAGPVSSTALVAGDYMEVKDQYFQLQRDLEIGPEGTGEAIVWPSVRSTFADGEDVITNSPKMVARITSDIDRRRVEASPVDISLSFEEV